MSEWYRLLSSGAGSDAPLSGAGVIGATVCMVWAAGLAGWCALKLHRRGSHKRRLLRRALERGFDREEAMNLWRLGRCAESGRRETILDSCEAFDRCVRAAERAAGDDPALWPEYLAGSVTSALRRKYGGPRRAPLRIAATREIERNQPLHVRLADGTAFKSFVLNVTEESLQLSLPGSIRAASDARASRSASVSFWRPHDARYEWTSPVIEEAQATGAERRLEVAHAPLSRVQEREFVRVRCRQEIRFGLRGGEAALSPDEAEMAGADGRATPPELPFTAMLNDLSNGGASFVTDRPILSAGSPAEPGTPLRLRIQLARKPWTLTLTARLLRQSALEGTSNRTWQSSVCFEALTGRAENHLGRFIAELQRRLIARMLSRSGAKEQDMAVGESEDGIERESPAWTSPEERPADRSSAEAGLRSVNGTASRERGRALETAQRS